MDSLALTRLSLLLLSTNAQPTAASPQALRRATALNELIDWIEAHLDQPINLETLQRQAQTSKRTLQYQFRHTFGCTPMQWVRQQRLNKALQLLSSPTGSQAIATVARRCGYSNLPAFSRDFKRMHGLRPSDVARSNSMRNLKLAR